jgi:hypothetical protein
MGHEEHLRMKKILLGTLAAAAMSIGLAVTPASADSFSQACADNANFGYSSHGECTSILTAYYNNGQGSNDVAAYCKYIKAVDAIDFFGGNVGQCIKLLKPYFPG